MAGDAAAALERLKRLHPAVIELSLGRLRRLLADLGDPQRAVAPVVHVAGTNGKGSTVAYLRAGLAAGGYRVQAYTSPHLVRFNERIRLHSGLVDDDALDALLAEVEAVNAGQPITFFEATTAAAFLAFARDPADVLLLEVGLGGRLDATNVIDAPALTVVTPVSLDHQSYLGDTVAAIAGEKAGILKPGVACVCARQSAEALAVIAARADALAAPLVLQDRDWTVAAQDGRLHYRSAARSWTLPLPALAGAHQLDNAGLALACLDRLAPRWPLAGAALAQAMTGVQWPARLHHLRHGPLVDALPPGWELWLDGGHNPAAGDALAAHVTRWSDRPLHLVFGMLGTKDSRGFLHPLRPFVHQTRAVAIPGEPLSLSAADAAHAAQAEGLAAARPAATVAAALADITAHAPAPARVLVCGSLYLAGTVLAENG